MSDQPENTNASDKEENLKPTITIAEKEGSEAASELAEKPTITIAEKDGGN